MRSIRAIAWISKAWLTTLSNRKMRDAQVTLRPAFSRSLHIISTSFSVADYNSPMQEQDEDPSIFAEPRRCVLSTRSLVNAEAWCTIMSQRVL